MKNSYEILSDFTKYTKFFLEENSIHNLISKNDENLLYEKHIYDSLGIKLFFEKYKITPSNILDIGCGGGFPCVPIAIEYPNIKVVGVDSIHKKINAVNNIKQALNIDNLELICERIENLKTKPFDVVVSRAVANLAKISAYALPHIKNNGFFIAYKSKKAESEIDDAEEILAKYHSKILDIIEYTLPTEEIYERKLICIQKNI